MSGGGGSSNRHGSGAGIILEGLNNVALPQSLCFKFKATNNHAEYEVVLAGLRLANDVGGEGSNAKVILRLHQNKLTKSSK